MSDVEKGPRLTDGLMELGERLKGVDLQPTSELLANRRVITEADHAAALAAKDESIVELRADLELALSEEEYAEAEIAKRDALLRRIAPYLAGIRVTGTPAMDNGGYPEWRGEREDGRLESGNLRRKPAAWWDELRELNREITALAAQEGDQ